MQREKLDQKSDLGGPSGPKVLEPLKKLLFEPQDSSSSNSREVCTSLTELTETVAYSAHRPNSAHLVSSSVELLVHACSRPDRDVRLAASENLRKLIKSLMNNHLSRLQQDLFHELKKNGSPRSLCVALECFSSLFPLTRPAKCSVYAQSLLPVLVRVTGREEESVHEALQDALRKILPTMTPFLSTTNMQYLMMGVIQRLPKAGATYRRMAASGLHGVITHTKKPRAQAEWLIIKLLDMGCTTKASSELVQGVMLILQQLFSSMPQINPPLTMLKQAFAFMVSCLVYRDANTAISALEALHQLLLSTTVEFSAWMTTTVDSSQLVTDFWCDTASDSTSDTQSQISEGLEMPCDVYFDEEVTLSFVSSGRPTTSPSKAVAIPSSSVPDVPPPQSPPAIHENACLPIGEGPNAPLTNLVKYLSECVLTKPRVSTQSLALVCTTAAVDIQPSVLTSLELVLPFTSATDPKLRSSSVKLLATVLSSHLRSHYNDITRCPPIVTEACNHINGMLEDDAPVVLKAVCEALQLCLPMLTNSTQPQRAVSIIRRLLSFREGSYWLTKVELLLTLSCLDFTSLAIAENRLPKEIINDVVFPLLGDSDHRVRTAACECLVSLAPRMRLEGDPVLAHAQWEAAKSFSHLHTNSVQFSLAAIGDTSAKTSPPYPMCLDYILWFLLGKISSSLNSTFQRGCLEALHMLSIHFSPASLPSVWACDRTPCTPLTVTMALLLSSWIPWGVQGHLELLEVCSSLFLSSSLSHMEKKAQTGQQWCALGEPTLVGHASSLLQHTTRVLCVFVHIIEQREPEPKESKRLSLPPGVSRRASDPMTSPVKPKPTPLLEPPLVPKDGIGHFAHLPQYLKIMDACKAAYTNYQVSLAPVGQDKFSRLLQATHNTLAALLEVAVADDIGKHVEELLGYLGVCVRVDYPGALLCVQQLLNALFGMNTAAQHTPLHSPYISSLPYNISMVASPPASPSLYKCTVLDPLSLLSAWLQAPPPSTLLSPNEEHQQGKKRFGFLPVKKSLVVKPVNPLSSIKDYLGYFEPLVVHAVRHFPFTSSILLQQRVLFLLVQLLQLKVRYELLDFNHTFLDAVLKLVGLMESGMVKGGERLVPHLFQFLVLLAYDQSRLITVPQVMQRCDGVMASGHSVTTFAIPALQPLVLNLFVRPSRESADLETQREVVLNMLLRLVEHQRVIVLLTYVLECYSRNKQKWQQVSTQIYAALLPHIGRLQVVLDTREALQSLYHLFTAMDPSTISLQALFMSVLKQSHLTTLTELLCWLGIICTVMELMIAIFPDVTLYHQVSALQFVVPEVHCSLVTVVSESAIMGDTPTQLAMFLRGTLYLALLSLHQLLTQKQYSDFSLLPMLTVKMLLLIQALIQGPYRSLQQEFASLPSQPSLSTILLQLSSSHPMITLHYIRFALMTECKDLHWVSSLLACSPGSSSSNWNLLHHCILVILPPRQELMACTSPAILQHTHSKTVQSLLSAARDDKGLLQTLVQVLSTADLSTPSHCLQVLQLTRYLPSLTTLHFLIKNLLPHAITAIALTASDVAMEIVKASRLTWSAEETSQLVQEVEGIKDRHKELYLLLYEMRDGAKEQSSSVHPLEPVIYPLTEAYLPDFYRLQSLGDKPGNGAMKAPISNEICASQILKQLTYHSIFTDWYVRTVQAWCEAPSCDPVVCAHVLASLEEEQIKTIMESDSFNVLLLESCLVKGIQLSMAWDSLADLDSDAEFSTTNQQPSRSHPLLMASVMCLLHGLRTNHHNVALTRPLLFLLVSKTRVNFPSDKETSADMAVLALHALQEACLGGFDSLQIQSAIDLCTMILQTAETQPGITEQWVCDVVSSLWKAVNWGYPDGCLKSEPLQGSDQVSMAKLQLRSVVAVLLANPAHCTLKTSFEALAFTLSRFRPLHPDIIVPPTLLGEGGGMVSDKVLDQALMESEVLREYMQRCNPIGWVSRPEFEERWMQLLGVVNQLPPTEGIDSEEGHTHIHNVCTGVQSVISLLLSTILRPAPGDPTSSVPLHTHRNSEVLFLGSRPGRKLAHLRRVLELQLLLQGGVRGNLPAFYQCPTLHHVSSPRYPPLYTQNVERTLGDTSIGPGQLSLNSLWPIMLVSATAVGRYSSGSMVEVDVRSCILSLIDLYTHWLSQPIHTLLLQHMLRSVVMLSDLFALSSQFEWMLGSLLHLQDTHPSEDASMAALLVLGVLKAAAVLRSSGADAERVGRVIEKSLTSDSAVSVQTACLQGVLYLSEDPSNAVLPLVLPTLTKYITTQLRDFTRLTESHILTVWSVALTLASHTHHLRDPEFTGCLLECVVIILTHPHTCTHTFQSLTLGLELLVINFRVTAQERVSLARTAASRFVKFDQNKSLAALALLTTCMYTGEEADALSGLSTDLEGSAAMETAAHAREHISNLLERLRHGPLVDVSFLVDVIPQLLVDFLLPMEALQTVVSEFVSPHQTRPHFAAHILGETFMQLLKQGQESMVTEWVLLSLESFVQQEPESKAVWSITCLLAAASTTSVLRSMLLGLAYQPVLPEIEALSLLCTAGQAFYLQQCIRQQQRELFLDKFQNSHYSSLKHVVFKCLHT